MVINSFNRIMATQRRRIILQTALATLIFVCGMGAGVLVCIGGVVLLTVANERRSTADNERRLERQSTTWQLAQDWRTGKPDPWSRQGNKSS
jgi:hypothetical protein